MNYEILNERFLKILSTYLNFMEDIVKESAVLEVEKFGVSKEYAFSLLLAEGLGLDTEGEDKALFREYFVPSVKELKLEDYYGDEYYKKVKFDGAKLGDVELKYLTQKAYCGFVRDDYEFFPSGKVLPKIGFFSKDYCYPAILSCGREWMTLLPNEINSQKRYISEASGKVLTYGLGLGYYVYHVARKKSVKSITVVDLDEKVIEVFNAKIKPCFERDVQDKITVIKADAFEFAKTLKPFSFDYIYADIWHDCGDGAMLYKKFKALEKFCPTARFGYWIEDSIKYYL